MEYLFIAACIYVFTLTPNKESIKKEITQKTIITDSKGCDTQITTIWLDQLDKDGKPLETCKGKILTGNQKTKIIYK